MNAKDVLNTMHLVERLTKIDKVLQECGVVVGSHDGVSFDFNFGRYKASCTWEDTEGVNSWDVSFQVFDQEKQSYGWLDPSDHRTSYLYLRDGVLSQK